MDQAKPGANARQTPEVSVVSWLELVVMMYLQLLKLWHLYRQWPAARVAQE